MLRIKVKTKSHSYLLKNSILAQGSYKQLQIYLFIIIINNVQDNI